MAEQLYWEDVNIGDEVPPFSRTTGFMNWNRFAAVNDEFISIHMDDEMARAMGQPGAIGMGNLRWSYLLNALRDWAGEDAEIVELGVQFRGTNLKNDTLSTHAVVTEKKTEHGKNLVVLDIDIHNQNDESTTPGHATIALP
jgi:acyl dehydratase